MARIVPPHTLLSASHTAAGGDDQSRPGRRRDNPSLRLVNPCESALAASTSPDTPQASCTRGSGSPPGPARTGDPDRPQRQPPRAHCTVPVGSGQCNGPAVTHRRCSNSRTAPTYGPSATNHDRTRSARLAFCGTASGFSMTHLLPARRRRSRPSSQAAASHSPSGAQQGLLCLWCRNSHHQQISRGC